MNNQHLTEVLVCMGQSRALVADYLDATKAPSVDGFFEYARESEESYNAQSRWDALQVKTPVFTSRPIEGCYALLNQVRRGS